jgi:hypothetical protein
MDRVLIDGTEDYDCGHLIPLNWIPKPKFYES